MKAFLFVAFCCFNICLAGSVNLATEKKNNDDLKNPLLKCWEIKDKNIQAFASDNNLLILQDREGQIISIDLDTKQELWKILIGNKNSNTIRILNNKIQIISVENESNDPKSQNSKNDENSENSENSERIISVRKINADSGIIERAYNFTGYENAKYLIVPNSDLMVFINPEKNSFLARLSGEKEIVWDKPFDIKGSETIVYSINADYFVATNGNKINQFRITDGAFIREIVSEKSDISAVLIYKNSIIWGDSAGKVFLYDPKTESYKKILRAGGKISWIRIFEDKMLIASDDNFVQYVSLGNKRILWKKRLSGRINLDPLESKDSIVLSTTAASEIYFLDKETGKIFNQVSLNNTEFIEAFQLNNKSLLVLTNQGLYKFQENCSE